MRAMYQIVQLSRKALFGLLLLAVSAAASAGPKWQLAGKTYNSVAFVDLSSVDRVNGRTSFTAVRVSGQPQADGWKKVIQRLGVNCATNVFDDEGSRIEKADGIVVSYPGSAAKQKALSRGVFFDMYQVVCRGKSGMIVRDPEGWTLSNFRPGS